MGGDGRGDRAGVGDRQHVPRALDPHPRQARQAGTERIADGGDHRRRDPAGDDGDGGNRITWANAPNPYCAGDVAD